jgi:hypothetical protein
MPAPTKQAFADVMTTILVQKYMKRDADGNQVTGELPEPMADLVNAIAESIAVVWTQWQFSQAVTGTATVTTAPGVAPVVANLP